MVYDLSQEIQELEFHICVYWRLKDTIKKMERAPDYLVSQCKCEKEKVWLLMDILTRADVLTDKQWNKYFSQIVKD